MQVARAHVVRRLAPGLGLALGLCASAAHAQYKSSDWDGKFLYGAYSTLVASDLLGNKHGALIPKLSDPASSLSDLAQQVDSVKDEYDGQTESQVDAIVKWAAEGRTGSIFEEERSVVPNKAANQAFLARMLANKAQLAPVDNMLQPTGFKSPAIQYNTHRGLYNNAYLIPQNSPASIVNAYISGIRNVEFDVLESRDNINVVVHDLVVNRLDGSYLAPPKFVKKWDYTGLQNTKENILNPLGATPSVEVTSIKTLMTTERFLTVVDATTSGMTLYADARNYAPASLLKLFVDKPALKANVVTKLYPFEMGGGVASLLPVYAARYKGDDVTAAGREIETSNPNLLLALGGAPTEATEEVQLSTAMNAGAVNFSWGEFGAIAKNLPFSRTSGATFKKFRGADVFTTAELAAIEAKTFLFARWTMDFAAVGNVRIFQTVLLPSLAGVIASDNAATYAAMAPGDKMLSAVTDNFIAIYKGVMSDALKVTITKPSGATAPLKSAWTGAGFGTSDRYPDYQFATRNGDGSVNQATLRSYYYGMPGTVGPLKEDYYSKQMRSSSAITRHIAEANTQGLPFRYVTTDLPEDMRAGAMGLFGTSWPAEIGYKPGGMIKAKLNPPHISTYNPPAWTANLWGTLRLQPTFAADLSAVSAKVSERDGLQKSLLRLKAFYETRKAGPAVLVDPAAIAAIQAPAAPYFDDTLSSGVYGEGVTALNLRLTPVVADVDRLTKAFATKYGVNWDGTPVTAKSRIDPATASLPSGNWDH